MFSLFLSTISLCHYSINKLLDGMFFSEGWQHFGWKSETAPVTKCCFSVAPWKGLQSILSLFSSLLSSDSSHSPNTFSSPPLHLSAVSLRYSLASVAGTTSNHTNVRSRTCNSEWWQSDRHVAFYPARTQITHQCTHGLHCTQATHCFTATATILQLDQLINTQAVFRGWRHRAHAHARNS